MANPYGNGTAIQPQPRQKAIVEGQEQQYAFAQAAMPAEGESPENDHPGFDLNELRLRLAAANAPLWSELVGSTDYNWMSRRRLTRRSRASSVVHRFDHAPGGSLCVCAYREMHSCEAIAKSLADGIARWRADDGNVKPFSGDRNLESAARVRLAHCVAALRHEGHSAADMYETPMIRWYVDSGIAILSPSIREGPITSATEPSGGRRGSASARITHPRRRVITAGQVREWTPGPISPADVVENAALGLLRRERATAKHETIIQVTAARLRDFGFEPLEELFDILAIRSDIWLLIEAKSLSDRNLRRQAMAALGQLAFYEYDIRRGTPKPPELRKLVAFDREVSDDHIGSVLRQELVTPSWVDGETYVVDDPLLRARIENGP